MTKVRLHGRRPRRRRPKATNIDALPVRVLFEQLHVFRAHVETINPDETEGPDLPGSGITALMSEFGALVMITRKLLSSHSGLAAMIRRVKPVPPIKLGLLDSAYPREVRIAKETLLHRSNLLIQAVGQLLQHLHLSAGWEALLHHSVRDASMKQFRGGHWREAQINAVMAVFDLIRARTGLDLDGDSLATRAFGVNQPLLTVADPNTTSGRDEQSGFMMLLQGIYRGTRNPRVHTLVHDLNLDALKTAQYLVFASLLARRVAEATTVTPPTGSSTTNP